MNIMKNLLRSTLYLSVFAIAGILFQISCSNSDSVKSNNLNSTPIGKLIYFKQESTNLPGGGTATTARVYTCNYDGTNETPVNFSLPTGVNIDFSTGQSNIRLSPDGQKVFFVTHDVTDTESIYTCDITGGIATQVVPSTGPSNIELGGAY